MSEIPKDRYALIIGAMKCATTSLFAYLAEHPAIAPARVKEPEFFKPTRAHRVAVARYEDLWDFDADRHRYAMEASTGYTKFDERGAAAAIHAYGIRPRLIYVVRDPFERIESHYNFMLQDPAWARDITDPSLVQTSNYYLYVEDSLPGLRAGEPADPRLRGAVVIRAARSTGSAASSGCRSSR